MVDLCNYFQLKKERELRLTKRGGSLAVTDPDGKVTNGSSKGRDNILSNNSCSYISARASVAAVLDGIKVT